jgi:long-chain acyl-CoA synthetase
MKEVEIVNQTLGNYETIKKIELLPREWTVDAGELSPKLSLKRRVIMENNKEAVERIYS